MEPGGASESASMGVYDTTNSLDSLDIPEPEILRGRIASMFRIYEAFVERTCISPRYNLLAPPLQTYFHKSQVSFSSQASKEKWLSDAKKTLEKPLSKLLFQSTAEQLAEERAGVALEEMASADVYENLLSEGRRSGRRIWTALFFTFDDSWHYWGAVLRASPGQSVIDVYIHPFDPTPSSQVNSGKRFTASQEKLQQACHRRGWRAELHEHIVGHDPDADIAFGWTQMWERKTT